jgi:hypothetical protein
MDCNNIVNFMGQQLKALKEVEELITYAEKQDSIPVKPEDMENLKNYITAMKLSANTALDLAKHFKNAGSAQPAKVKTEPAPVVETEDKDAAPSEVEKPKRRRTKKQETSAQGQGDAPPKEEPVAADNVESEEVTAEEPIEDEFDFLM